MEKTAYAILIVLAGLWIVGMIVGMIAALPFGLLGLAAIVAVGLLFLKVLRERLARKEDDYYADHVEK